MLCLAVFLPIVAGLAMLIVPPKTRAQREWAVEGVTIITSLIVLFCLTHRSETPAVAFMLMQDMPVAFVIDGLGSVFTALVAFLWPLAVLYGFEYMEHEGGENHFFALYTITYGVTLGISTAANIMTMYIFYEFLTLCTLPLVMHGTSRESIKAGHQYMLYSFFGAAIAFVGVMIIVAFGEGGAFVLFPDWDNYKVAQVFRLSPEGKVTFRGVLEAQNLICYPDAGRIDRESGSLILTGCVISKSRGVYDVIQLAITKDGEITWLRAWDFSARPDYSFRVQQTSDGALLAVSDRNYLDTGNTPLVAVPVDALLEIEAPVLTLR